MTPTLAPERAAWGHLTRGALLQCAAHANYRSSHDRGARRLLDAARAAIVEWLDVPPEAFDLEG